MLSADEPAPVRLVNRSGPSPFLLIGDHAGNAIPRSLGNLGVGAADRVRHIACDIGTAALGDALAARLDAPFVSQRYSRLVIDCNRDPAAADAMPVVSDATPIPGNADLDEAGRAARVAAIHRPYQDAIAAALAERRTAGAETVLVSIHSFTPRLLGGAAGEGLRPWHVGLLHNRHNDGFTHALLAELRAVPGLVVGDNQPYQMDGIDHTVPRHAFPAGLPYAEIEVRQDLIGDEAGVARWAEILAGALTRARRRGS